MDCCCCCYCICRCWIVVAVVAAVAVAHGVGGVVSVVGAVCSVLGGDGSGSAGGSSLCATETAKAAVTATAQQTINDRSNSVSGPMLSFRDVGGDRR